MQEAREMLLSSAKTLFSEHHVGQNTIFDWIRDELTQNISDAHTICVLFNACNGRFGLSQPYRKFVQDVTGNTDRVSFALHIDDFARHVLSRMDGLEAVLSAYDELCLRDKYFTSSRNPTIVEECFILKLISNGYRDSATWLGHAERVYNSARISFLIQNPRYVPGDGRLSGDSLRRFGLLCASDRDSCLAIAHVPRGMDWDIDEYNGKENIIIV